MNIIWPTIVGTYTGTLAAALHKSGLDQKIFDFVTPKFSHAFTFGVCTTLSYSLLSRIVEEATGTTWETIPGSQLGPTHTELNSKHEKAYQVGNFAAGLLSVFGSVYLLQNMNYNISYRFALIALIPILGASN